MMHAIQFRISESNETTKEKPEANEILKRCLSQNPNQDNGSTKQTLKSFSQILHTTCHIIKCNLGMAVRYTAGSVFSLSTQNARML